MGLIIKEQTVKGTRRSDTARVLYDSGASSSFIRRDIADIVGDTSSTVSPLQFMMADGQVISADQTINLEIEMNGITVEYRFLVLDDLPEEVIIGADLMQKWKISLDLENETVYIDPRALYLNSRA